MWDHGPRMAAAGAPPAVFNPGEMRELLSYIWARQFFEDAGDPARGRRVFTAKRCAECHETGAAPKLPAAGGAYSAPAMIAALWRHGPAMLDRMKAQWHLLAAPGRGRHVRTHRISQPFAEEELEAVMIWRSNRPLVDALTGHWVSMTGTALVTLAGFSWLFLLPMHVGGHANNPYIGLFAFVVLPLIFFTGLILIPIGAALGRRRVERGLAVAIDRRQVWRRAGIFFAVMTAANLVIGSQLSYRAVEHMDSVQFCGQTCHVMKPEFTAHQRPPHAAVACVDCHVAPGASGFIKAKIAGTRQLIAVIRNDYPRPDRIGHGKQSAGVFGRNLRAVPSAQ